MKNIHSTDGLAEDLIRSFVQVACAEIHLKTLHEKRVSEMENGIVDMENPKVAKLQFEKIDDIRAEITECAQSRREDMLFLYELFESKGDKEKWCSVKHLGIAMMCTFEAWQASDNDMQLESMFIRKNAMFLKAVTQFLGVEVTECASCFADIMKGENHG